MTEHDDKNEAEALWNEGFRSLPPHVTPAVRGERKPVDTPAKQPTEKESD
jgi:hypothetical protein